jgi:methylated-DNA-[protein]-cysteine S-methyltransferase
MKSHLYKSPLGTILIEEENNHLVGLRFGSTDLIDPTTVSTSFIQNAKEQLDAYFKKQINGFDIPIAPKGTPFQKKIWEILLSIPFGKHLTYTEVAQQYGNLNSIRAVGAAIGKNPILILIPCHRVLGKNGSMVGYAGGIQTKICLLEHEGLPIQKSLDL